MAIQPTPLGYRTVARPEIIRPGRASIRTTYQLITGFACDGKDITDVFTQATNIALQWLRSKFPLALPTGAWKGEAFEIEEWGQKIECVAIPDEGIWAGRLVQPDAPFRARKAVAGRVWTTDIALRRRGDSVGLGARVICASLPYSTEEISLTRPRVVIDLAQNIGLEDCRPLNGRAWMLESVQDLERFRDILIDPSRSMPVFLLTQPDQKRLPTKVAPFLLNYEVLARRVQAQAHVVLMPWELGFKWTEMVGKPWSAFLGAVRTFYPGLDFDQQLPSSHPRAFAEDVLFWRYGDNIGEGAFEAFLVEQSLRYAATKRVLWGDLDFVSDARTRRAELARQQTTLDSEWKTLYEQEIAALKEKLTEVEKDAEAYNDDAIQSAADRDHYVEENGKLRAQIDSLRARLAKKMEQDPDETIPIPNSYEDLPDWVSANLAGRLCLHPRALRGLKDARYEEPSLVYRCLVLLSGEYRRMRLGFDGAKTAFEAGLDRLQVKCDGSITKERAGEQGDTYYVRYPIGSQQTEFLEFHLRKGSTKDTRYCLAIYFFWDDKTHQVVVGWLPSHLDNRMT